MKENLNYKDFKGSVQYSVVDQVFYGRLFSIDDLVSYEAKSLEQLEAAFIEAVEDYLELLTVI